MLPYARPSMTDDEIAEVEACLRSGWLATGPRAGRFEQLLGARLGVRHALGASTGTAALHLAVLACGIRPGDEVVTTPMTWVSTANVLLHAGAVPVFADVEPTTLNLDPARVAEVLGPRTRAILPVHFAGLPCDEDAFLDLARSHGLFLVEDAAHALGASYKGRAIGSIADATMFSFHPAKNLTTGEGGAVATDSDEIAERVRLLRFHGIAQTPESRFGGRGPVAYDVVEAGFKYNFSDIQAAIGIHQLARLDEMNRRRVDLARAYRERLATVPHVEPLGDAPYEHEHAWHILVASIEPDALTIGRDEVIGLLRAAGIGAGLHFVPLHLQTLYRPMADAARLPVATEANRRILTLPLFPDMEDADVDRVVDTLAGILREHARRGAASPAAAAS
ncbi:MAG: DegT/DnrJ/EryC1/StrS family aminotransferase [Alphaproteobacteria bacterium]